MRDKRKIHITSSQTKILKAVVFVCAFVQQLEQIRNVVVSTEYDLKDLELRMFTCVTSLKRARRSENTLKSCQ